MVTKKSRQPSEHALRQAFYDNLSNLPHGATDEQLRNLGYSCLSVDELRDLLGRIHAESEPAPYSATDMFWPDIHQVTDEPYLHFLERQKPRGSDIDGPLGIVVSPVNDPSVVKTNRMTAWQRDAELNDLERALATVASLTQNA